MIGEPTIGLLRIPSSLKRRNFSGGHRFATQPLMNLVVGCFLHLVTQNLIEVRHKQGEVTQLPGQGQREGPSEGLMWGEIVL
jgi:hypothetical protein